MENLINLIEHNPILAIAGFVVLFIVATIIRKSLKLIVTLIIMLMLIAGIVMYQEGMFKEENIKSLQKIDISELKRKTDKIKANTKDKLFKHYKEKEEEVIPEENLE